MHDAGSAWPQDGVVGTSSRQPAGLFADIHARACWVEEPLEGCCLDGAFVSNSLQAPAEATKQPAQCQKVVHGVVTKA